MNKRIRIDEIRGMHINANCVAERTYKFICWGLEVNLKMTGCLCVVDVIGFLEDGKYSYGFMCHVITFVQRDSAERYVSRLTVKICSVELRDKKVEINLDTCGTGSLAYRGSCGEILSGKDWNICADGYVIQSILESVARLAIGGNVKELLDIGDWEIVESIHGDVCTLFDIGNQGYIRLNENILDCNLLGEDTRSCVGYLLKRNVSYFVMVESLISGNTILTQGVDYCIFKDNDAFVMPNCAIIINKRFM